MSRPSTTLTAISLALLGALQAQQQAGGSGQGAVAQAPARPSTIEERTTGMQRLDGYFPVYWEERTGNLWLEIPSTSVKWETAANQRKALDALSETLKPAAQGESEQAQHALLAADIKRFLERPAETTRIMPAPDAPPGAPIGGDAGINWLAPAPR